MCILLNLKNQLLFNFVFILFIYIAVQGFASDFSNGNKGETLLLNEIGCIWINNKGYIKKEWKYNQNLQASGTPPKNPIKIRLNDYFEFTFINKEKINVKFQAISQPSITYNCECGLVVRR